MAATMNKLKSLLKVANLTNTLGDTSSSFRFFGISSVQNSEGKGWLDKILVRKIEPTHESHSGVLGSKQLIYELNIHDVKPDSVNDYIKNYENFSKLIKGYNDSKDVNMELMGSWIVGVGQQDQFVHLWKYTGGYSSVDLSNKFLRYDQEAIAIKNERSKFVQNRQSQYLLHFSFWPQIKTRAGPNVYEMRSYRLKAGTMIEWGNNWARGIQYRMANDEPFAGFFTQVGPMFTVHYIWAYESYVKRKETRENAWTNPGWDDCVANTVPLIKTLDTRIMVPTPFSPTQ